MSQAEKPRPTRQGVIEAICLLMDSRTDDGLLWWLGMFRGAQGITQEDLTNAIAWMRRMNEPAGDYAAILRALDRIEAKLDKPEGIIS